MKRPTSFITVLFVALMLFSSAFVSAVRADDLAAPDGINDKSAAATAQKFSAQFSKYFVTTAWVKSHLNSAVIIDTRDASYYDAGHIKGAINVPSAQFTYSRVEGTDGTTILHMMPTPTQLIELVNNLGIKNSNTTVITYGHNGADDWGVSTRLAWNLQLFGHKKAYNMDGGHSKFNAEYPKYTSTSTTLPTPNTKSYVLSGYSDILATKYDVLEAVTVTDTGTVIFDTRTQGEYDGTGPIPGNPRNGHIPNAVFLDWAGLLFMPYTIPGTSTTVKVLKSETALRQVFTDLFVTKDKTVIPYCEGGFRSAHVTFILLGLGYPSVRHYQGSWCEWSRQNPTAYPAVVAP